MDLHDNSNHQSSGRPTCDATDREDIVVQALKECQAAIDLGTPIDRALLMEKYPDIRDELSACLEGVELMRQSASIMRNSETVSNESPKSIVPLATVGDFRILREIGRGGMGVVYEAEQLSLGRKMAIKVLPFASLLDSRHLDRFKNESRAAASLNHPNIVGVHSVGCERGVHYYAMELVEGQSLAEIIAQLRNDTVRGDGEDVVPTVPTDAETKPVAALSTERETDSSAFFRRVAGLGIQAAEALDHAHGVGIVHRDIKPSNLMVDMAGKLLITDFGLAQIQGEGNLTMTGDLVGTLRYMSPEQADGDRAVLDHRADIYSLGITLYELLTLRPAFEGTDKAKLLRDILEHEPPAPRTINSAIPRDLETIVLKATAKDPGDRYASATELVADLRRFVEDAPIRAKRISLAERSFRWIRRHSAAVSAVTMVLLVVSVAAVTGAVMFARRGNELAQRSAQLATALHESRENFDIARQAVDDMYSEFAENWINNQPHLTKMQRAYVEKALEFYETVPEQYGDDLALQLDAARAKMRLGKIHQALGDVDKAVTQFDASIEICRRLTEQYSGADDFRILLAESLIQRATIRFHNFNGYFVEQNTKLSSSKFGRFV